MFTGLIEEIGSIKLKQVKGDSYLLEISCPAIASQIKLGDSIAVNGVCLTAVSLTDSSFTADVSPETVKRSTFSKMEAGDFINLEQALAVNGRLGGHFVQGHVDGIGQFLYSKTSGSGWEFHFSYPENLGNLIVEKGSIAIDGISLTVAALEKDSFSVAVVPHTVKLTCLGKLRKGDSVNLETDILGKYVEKMLNSRGKPKETITEAFLSEHGFGS